MMEKDITCDWIDRYNEGELDEIERAYMQQLMRVNPWLQSEVLIDASLNRFLEEEDVLDLMNKVRVVTRQKGDAVLRRITC